VLTGNKPLSTQGVYHVLRRHAKRSGVTRFNPHSFRHRLAKKLEAAQMPHKVLQDVMGWESAAMVQHYVNYSPTELQAMYDLFCVDSEK
jgi:integrase